MIKYGFVLIFTLVLLGCKPNSEKYGMSRNRERIKDSLPLLPDNWVLQEFGSDIFTWEHPDKDLLLRNNEAFHGEKKIQIYDGKIYNESDRYYSGAKYILNEGGPDEIEIDENIAVSRNYKKSIIELWGEWSTHPQCKDASNPVNISLKEVDVILDKWGIKRLNW